MNSILIGSLLLAAGSILSADEHSNDVATAQWIWCETERKPSVTADFRKRFAISKGVTTAVLRGVGESAGMMIRLNGMPIASVEPYDPLLTLDITDRLGSGNHELAVQSTSCQGPAAFFLQLDLIFDDRSRLSVVTDTTWVASKRKPADVQAAISFGAVSDRLLIPEQRRVGISAVDNYEQWKQALGSSQGTDPASFLVTPGYEISRVRSAQPDEDSWVSLAFDPQGRVVIAKEEQGLLRMTLSQDGDQVTQVETINDTLEECRGLLFALGDLFVNANNSKALYRLSSNENDEFGKPKLLYTSSGGVGHGRNDLALGPDRKVYMIHGDAVDLPTDGIDFTSPFREARRGQLTREGHLLRIDPEGGQVELLASGLRNPFGIDFNSDGEIFTYDADAEYDMGAPWYRPTRVNHLVIGSDYGWRGVTKSWPPYFPDHPDNAPPNLDIGKGSPTAVKFGTRSNFPERLQQALFILDWAYGRIIAVHMTPRGSSYLLTAETFLKGRPLNVTDLDFGPDGSMYLITGGRRTQSALYRVRYTGQHAGRMTVKSRQQRARDVFARQSRNQRRHLESLLRKEFDESTVAQVWPHLADSDPWIRYAARNVMERQPIASWETRACTEENLTAALAALLGLARSGDKTQHQPVLRRLNDFDLHNATRSEKVSALYVYWICLTGQSQVGSELLSTVTKRLGDLYPDRSFAVNRLLSELLVSLSPQDSIAKTIELLKAAGDPVEKLHYLFVLRNTTEGWTLDQREAYFRELAQSDTYLGGAGMPDFLKRIRQEAVASLTASERQALPSSLVDAERETPGQQSQPRPLVRKWTVNLLTSSFSDLEDGRDLRRGAAMFTAASCVNCHRFAGHGTPVGPDLTSVSSRFSRRDLLASIIAPSDVIPEKFRSLQIVTSDGKIYTGQVALGGDYRSPVLRLSTNPENPFQITEIPKTEIQQQHHSSKSWMPEGLLDTLTKQEILDLLAYLESQGSISGTSRQR